jgi:hypothetical protein
MRGERLLRYLAAAARTEQSFQGVVVEVISPPPPPPPLGPVAAQRSSARPWNLTIP